MRNKNVSYKNIDITGGFWKDRQDLNKIVTIYAVRDRFKDTGRFDAFKCDWTEGKPKKPHFFWDSDVAKWMESAAYILSKERNEELEKEVDALVDLIEKNQDENGYFNIYFTVVEPDERFTIRDAHELYCAGHLIEAAVAYYEATGKDKFLKLMKKYADYIEKVFKIEDSAEFATPGHEEIELALVRLYRCTGEEKYLNLSKHFIDSRGARGDKEELMIYNQSHMPVREQRTAEGHSVRACYLYSGMADIAAEFDDEELKVALNSLFDNIVNRRMYVTGGIGSSHHGEAFTIDYDLSNPNAYAETCAAISLAMFAGRMNEIRPNGKYGDIVEKVIYNGFLSGLSLDGKSFFYENPLEIVRADRTRNVSWPAKERFPLTKRKEVFDCSCCPPNVTRFIASIGGYVYTVGSDENTLYVNQYMESVSNLKLGDADVEITQKTNYPWDGKVNITAKGMKGKTLALRIPAWSEEFTVEINGKTADIKPTDGFARIEVDADEISAALRLDVSPFFVECNPKVNANAGRVALQAGPVVYCLEEIDNGPNLRDISISREPDFKVKWFDELGVQIIEAKSFRTKPFDELYRRAQFEKEECKAVFIPYFAFANREECDMLVWTKVE